MRGSPSSPKPPPDRVATRRSLGCSPRASFSSRSKRRRMPWTLHTPLASSQNGCRAAGMVGAWLLSGSSGLPGRDVREDEHHVAQRQFIPRAQGALGLERGLSVHEHGLPVQRLHEPAPVGVPELRVPAARCGRARGRAGRRARCPRGLSAARSAPRPRLWGDSGIWIPVKAPSRLRRKTAPRGLAALGVEGGPVLVDAEGHVPQHQQGAVEQHPAPRAQGLSVQEGREVGRDRLHPPAIQVLAHPQRAASRCGAARFLGGSRGL